MAAFGAVRRGIVGCGMVWQGVARFIIFDKVIN